MEKVINYFGYFKNILNERPRKNISDEISKKKSIKVVDTES